MTIKTNVTEILKNVAQAFQIKGDVESIFPYGSGHINDTYYIKNTDTEAPDYILQRVNSYVFTDVPALIKNIELVTKHIRIKMQNIPGYDADKEVLTLISTYDNEFYHIDTEGSYWRMYYFLKDTNSYDILTSPSQAYQGGKAFGRFQACLSDMDASLLVETIPDFHNIEKRIDKLKAIVQEDVHNRVEEVIDLLGFVLDREEVMKTILNLGRNGEIPLRITHNDTKFNNVLLTKDDIAQCVIDLDTVMPGYVAYDFGDAIRTSVNKAAEDEKDLSKIDIDLDIFKAFAEGYLSETGSFLSKAEVNSLAWGTLLLPYMIGVRFLTDYIDGDKYFKIHSPKHNLQRARAQFQLLKKLEDNYHTLQEIVLNEAKKQGNQYIETNSINFINKTATN